jgi:DNA-binding XRE family transcriptional regulator
MTRSDVHEQSNKPLVNQVRVHRRRVGLTQRDLARLLGYQSYGIVASHERCDKAPSLTKALTYQILFQVPFSEIFAGITETVELEVEARLVDFETYLGGQSAQGPRAAAIARKMEWLAERRGSGFK